MTTENFKLKKDDIIVGNDGFGDTFGYYIETKTDKLGIWVYFGATKTKSRGVYVRKIEDVRLATKKEAATFEV